LRKKIKKERRETLESKDFDLVRNLEGLFFVINNKKIVKKN
jgi:hypothetical protein